MVRCPECGETLEKDYDGPFCESCGWDALDGDNFNDVEPNNFDDIYYDDPFYDDDDWDDLDEEEDWE